MDNSVTKEQVEEALKTIPAKFYTIDGFEKELLERLFPPPFKPKRGQVIACRNNAESDWTIDVFREMADGGYYCKVGLWAEARPLTQAEINGESDGN